MFQYFSAPVICFGLTEFQCFNVKMSLLHKKKNSRLSMFQHSCVIIYYHRFMGISMFRYQSVIDKTFSNNPLKWQGARSGYRQAQPVSYPPSGSQIQNLERGESLYFIKYLIEHTCFAGDWIVFGGNAFTGNISLASSLYKQNQW